MKETIVLLADIVNHFHDVLYYLAIHLLGLDMTDKDLHFWIMGIIGFAVFLLVLTISKAVSRLPYGITILSFLYTFTFMTALVFAVEIQQAITNRGNMEFEDAVIGLAGYVVFFLLFAILSLAITFMNRLFQRSKHRGRTKKI